MMASGGELKRGGDWWSGEVRTEAPHPVGEDDECGKQDDEPEGWRRVGEDKRKCVHRGVEDDDGEDVATGTIVEPRKDDGDRDKKNDADQEVTLPGKAKRAMEVERGVPKRPGKPYEETGQERRKLLLEAGEKEPAPARFFEGRGEKEIAQERDAAIGSGQPERAVLLRPDEGAVKEMHDGGGDEEDCRPEQKRGGLPTPMARLDKSMQQFADSGIAREGAGENPGGKHGEESDEGIIGERSGRMNAAEFVVGDVAGRREQPKQGEGKNAHGQTLGDFSLAAAREEDRGERGTSGTEGHDVFAVVRACPKELRGDPDEPGDGIGENKKGPDLFFHIARDISLKRNDGNRRDEKRPPVWERR